MREQLAELAHKQWSGWMKYLFDKSKLDIHGNVVIPRELVERWNRQMFTQYAELPENEKDSDRAEADRVLKLTGDIRQAAFAEAAHIAFTIEKQAALDGANLSGESAAFAAGMEHATNVIQAQIKSLVAGINASQQRHAVDLASLRSPNH